MKLDRFIYELMVVSPLAVLLVLATQARTAPQSFVPYAYSPREQAAIAQWIPLMRLMQRGGSNPLRMPRYDEARRLAQAWTAAIDAGKAPAFASDNVLDTMRDGVKGQIRTALQNVTASLYRGSVRMVDTNPDEVLENLELSVKLAEVHKYADLYGVGYFSGRQILWLELAPRLHARLNAAGRARLIRAIESIETSPQKVELLVHRAERHYVHDGTRRHENRIGILAPSGKSSGQAHRQLMLAMAMTGEEDLAFATQSGGISFAHQAVDEEARAKARFFRSIGPRY